MQVQYTEEQLRAINTMGSLIVSASAGSGKTTVMIERIFRLLCQGIDIDSIFITTFTKASAIDMKRKLKLKLQKADTDNPSGIPIEDIIDSIDTTNIGTFHSVCGKIIRTHFYSCDIDPDFILMDEQEQNYLLGESILSTIEKYNENPTEDYLNLYRVFLSKRKDTNLRDLIKRVYYFAIAQINPQEWLKNSTYAILNPQSIQELLATQSQQNIQDMLQITQNYTQKAQELGMYFNEYTQELMDKLQNRPCEYSKLVWSDKRVKCDKENPEHLDLVAQFKKFREQVKDYIDNQNSQQLVDSRLCGPYAQCIVDLVLDTMQHYEQQKIKYAKLDFGDIEHAMIRVLQDENAQQILSQKIKYMFVDEYQDINPLQDHIISKLATNAESFFVGDVKQSIYGFRMCDPKYFVQKLNDPQNTIIHLNGNFRSSSPILQFINQVFSPIMTQELGGVDYANTSMLSGSTLSTIQNPVVITQIQPPIQEDKSLQSKLPLYDPTNHPQHLQENGKNLQAEVEAVATHIYNLNLEQNVPCKDIAVLVRSRSQFAYQLQQVLTKCGIDSFVGEEKEWLQTEEIATVFNYLKLVDYPKDDISLVAVLTSGMYDLTSLDLETIQMHYTAHQAQHLVQDKTYNDQDNNTQTETKQKSSFFDKCKYYSQEGDDFTLKTKLQTFFDNLKNLTIYNYTHTVQDLAGKIVSSHDYFLKLHTRPNGDTKAQSLYQYLSQLEQNPHNADLAKYIYFTTENAQKTKDIGSENAVSIITAHASKGLEYDYLIVADLAKQFNNRDTVQRVLLHNESMAMHYFDLENGESHLNAVYQYIQSQKQQNIQSEELRLFYVALTRAKKQLALFLRLTKDDYQAPKLGQGKGQYNLPEQAKSWLDFVYPACSRIHKKIPSTYQMPRVEQLDIKKVYSKPDPQLTRQIMDFMQQSSYSFSSKGVKTKTTVTRFLADLDDNQQEQDMYDTYDTDGNLLLNVELRKLAQIKKQKAQERNKKSKQMGTNYHKMLELLDFNQDFVQAFQRLTTQLSLTSTLKSTEIAKLQKAHAIISQLTQGNQIYKEKAFVQNLSPQLDSNSLMQGKIDLLIIQDDTATIIEYKTTVPRDKLIPYTRQLSLYAQAIHQIIHPKKIKTLIYDISKSKLIEVQAESIDFSELLSQ